MLAYSLWLGGRLQEAISKKKGLEMPLGFITEAIEYRLVTLDFTLGTVGVIISNY